MHDDDFDVVEDADDADWEDAALDPGMTIVTSSVTSYLAVFLRVRSSRWLGYTVYNQYCAITPLRARRITSAVYGLLYTDGWKVDVIKRRIEKERRL